MIDCNESNLKEQVSHKMPHLYKNKIKKKIEKNVVNKGDECWYRNECLMK